MHCREVFGRRGTERNWKGVRRGERGKEGERKKGERRKWVEIRKALLQILKWVYVILLAAVSVRWNV